MTPSTCDRQNAQLDALVGLQRADARSFAALPGAPIIGDRRR